MVPGERRRGNPIAACLSFMPIWEQKPARRYQQSLLKLISFRKRATSGSAANVAELLRIGRSFSITTLINCVAALTASTAP